MKNTLTLAGILLVTVCSLLTACKKEKDMTAHEKYTALIADRNWKIVFYGYDRNKDGVLDYDFNSEAYENVVPPCMADDEWEFRADSTFYIRALGELNGCGLEDGGPFPWSLSEDCKELNYSKEINKVLKLNDTVLVMSVMIDGEECIREFRR